MSAHVANDNIQTSHLKCDDCGTRTRLGAITSADDGEFRKFECDLCGRTKVLHVRNKVSAKPIASRDAV